MSYEVLVDDLRAAAGRYRTIASSLGADGVELAHVDPSSMGHIELAAWIKAVAEQCDAATQALHDGAVGVAEGLESAARHYETTDTAVGQAFQTPFELGPAR
jgi:hypothetical protein